MRFRRHPALLVAAILTATLIPAATASAQGQSGDKAEIKFKPTEWINEAPLDLENVRGRAIALAFIRLSGDESLYFMEVWDDLQDEFSSDPVCFAAITNEATDYLKEQVSVEGIRSALAVDPTDAAAPSFAVQLFPSVVIIDPRGTITYHETPGSHDDIRDALNLAVQLAPPLGTAPGKHKAIAKLLDKDEAGKAYEALVAAIESPRIKEDEKVELSALSRALEVQASRMLRASDRYVEEKNWVRGVAPLERLSTFFKGIPAADQASARLEALNADDAVKEEVAAARAFAEGQRQQRIGDKKKAAKCYESVVRLHPDTQAAELAAQLAEYLSQ